MHSTEHKAKACALPRWQHRNADRTCEHGDSRMKSEIKRQAAIRRRRADRKEASER